jgi:uncharacterized membrane protein
MLEPQHWLGSRLLIGCALVLTVVACGGNSGEATGSTCPADSTLTYTSFGQNFMQTHCVSCHNAGGPESPALSTLEQVRANLSEVDRAAAAGPAATNTSMPEGSSITQEERLKLGEWLACGAPE